MAVDFQQIIDGIDAAILKAIEAGGVVEYSIAGRALRRYDINELTRLRDKYQAMLNRQNGQPCINMKRARYRGNRFGC